MGSKKKFDSFGGSSITSSGDKVRELKDVLKGKNEVSEQRSEENLPDQLKGGSPLAQLPEAGVEELDSEIKVLEEKYKKAEQMAKTNEDQYIRTLAEFANFRKRMEREKGEMLKYGNEKILTELLPVLDHFEMSLHHADQNNLKEIKQNQDSIIEGVELVVKQFASVLEKFGVEVVTGEAEPFDPHKQEAIGTVETKEYQAGYVTHVHRKGYRLNGRLIRPAMVTVAQEPSVKSEEEEETVH